MAAAPRENGSSSGMAQSMAPEHEADAEAEAEPSRHSPAELAFIAEHGRLLRPESSPEFDPFRRAVCPTNPSFLESYVLPALLIPLRLLLALVASFLTWAVVMLVGPRVNDRILHEYGVERLPPWRRRLCAAANSTLGRALLMALGFWRVHGTDDPKFDPAEARGVTVVSNHVGLGDPCLLAYVCAPAFVAKMAVARIPLIGRVGAAQHAFYIDRLNAGARNTTAAIIERQRLSADPAAAIPPVCIFPEGTTTNGRHLLRFRTGAFVAGTPVAPILLRYPYTRFSPSYEAIRTKTYVLGLLRQPANSVHYYRLPVYFPNAQEREDPRLYADNVRKLMQERSDFLDGQEKLLLSESNFIDKAEYLAIIRGDKLREGVKLSPVK